jgi:hypothetical protein
MEPLARWNVDAAMQQHDQNPPASVPASQVALDAEAGRAPDAKRHFASPELLMADQTLGDAEKRALLEDWAQELLHRLESEQEGFSAQDPIRESSEARLADEAARVRTLLAELAAKSSPDA